MIYIIGIAIVALFGPHLWAKYVLEKYNRQEYFSGTGIDLARMILNRLNINDVTVDVTDIGDHYDPVGKAVRLTRKICGRKTLTAVVVAAHEVGHAIQDHTGYKPLKTRTRMIGTAQKMKWNTTG
jgi:Zn-dependent membrane protease YugP